MNRIPGTDSPRVHSDRPVTLGATEDHRSLGDLVSSHTSDLSLLMRQEVELAKAEVRQSATRAGAGAGMLAGAGVAGFFVLMFLSTALWSILTHAVGRSWAATIVALLWAVVAGVLAAMGRSRLKAVQGVPQTTETVKQIPNALTGNEQENR